MWCFCCRLTSVINVVLWELKTSHEPSAVLWLIEKKLHWLQSGDYTVLHSAKVQTEGTAACSFEGERNSFVVEASFSLLVLLSLRLKAWFVFFSKPQWVKNVKRTVCLILCVLNKNTGVLVCMSAQLVPVCANCCPFVDIWCPRASPLGRSFGFWLSAFFTKERRLKMKLCISPIPPTLQKMLLLNC